MSVAKAGGTITTYSDRFSLSGMTAEFPANVKTALAAGVPGTAGPLTDNKVAAAVPNAPGAAAAGDYGIPYNQQTGLTRFAPMQPVPKKTITATNTAPLWPTSAVQFAKTHLPIPSIVTTLTQAQTFSVASHANTVWPFLGIGLATILMLDQAAPASSPVDDMHKFLNRWKD